MWGWWWGDWEKKKCQAVCFVGNLAKGKTALNVCPFDMNRIAAI
jgi:hypothetical protein